MITNTKLEQLFLASTAYAARPFCLSTDGDTMHDMAVAMAEVSEELMRRRREAEVAAQRIAALEREEQRLRLALRDLELRGLP